MTALVAAVAWGGALLLVGRPSALSSRVFAGPAVDTARQGPRDRGSSDASPASTPVSRAVLSAVAGTTLGLVLGGPGPGGLAWGAAVTAAAWWVLHRAPLAAARQADRAVAADLPFLVLLLAAGLRAGGSAGSALRCAQEACPGPAADRLRPLTARLAWGVDPAEVWDDLARDPALGALGRRLARSHRTGASIADAVSDLAAELAAQRRGEVEDLARGVGVRAALPLGLCLLPAFLLLGIVPVVAGLVGELAWQ